MIEFKLEGVEDTLRLLQSLPPEIVSKSGGPVKLALKKGAKQLLTYVQQNLAHSIAIRGDESTGLLMSQLRATRGRPPEGIKGELYKVWIRRKRYQVKDKQNKKHQVTTIQTGVYLEYGTQHQPATPWLRPALMAHGTEIINLVTTDLNQRIKRIIKKLSKAKKA